MPASAPVPGQAADQRALPRAPVLSWRGLFTAGSAHLPSVADLPHGALTTSGRAALLAALLQMQLRPGQGVLVPTYHCPTMVAPVLAAGLQPVFFPIDGDGLPRLQDIPQHEAERCGAMFVAHYFGVPHSLGHVQAWCHERSIKLVEDCAHCYFGMAGSQAVGTWGDYATASLSKFFPVAEGGLLASARYPLRPLGLTSPGWRTQLKSAVDVLEASVQQDCLPGLSHLLAPLLRAKNRDLPSPARAGLDPPPEGDSGFFTACDMGRVQQRPTLATRVLARVLPEGWIVRQRRANFEAYGRELAGAVGARPLHAELPADSAPYVWPLWIDGAERADRIYASIRTQRLPVFRWDFLWPRTPEIPDDAGRTWSRQVLQLLCHQDLGAQDIALVTDRVRRLLAAHALPGPIDT